MSVAPIDITQIVIAVTGLLAAIITAVVAPYLKAKTTQAKWENAMYWVKLAVEGAEKIYKDQGLGKLKKQYVEQFLKDHNIKLDEEQIDVAIEAAVLQMQNAMSWADAASSAAVAAAT